jgi:undecaprenyl-diphosphatase
MTLTQIILLAVIQGLAELLPVSSSAHVIAAAKLMHLKPEAPEFTLLLVMLHTGTMFAVIVYFWKAWKRAFFSSHEVFVRFANRIVIATAVTGIIGFGLKLAIEKYLKHTHPGHDAEIEELFSHLELLAVALAAAGVLILFSGLASRRRGGHDRITLMDSLAIGAVQGLCLPFRGFSRSGATISVALLRQMARAKAEEYSFALAVVLTPFVVGREALRFAQHHAKTVGTPIGMHEFAPSLIGMVFSFLAGLIALKVLSRLLEKGQWWIFGVYCLVAASGVFWMYLQGY